MYAIGVTPAVEVIDFEPGLMEEVKVTILNRPAANMKVLISAQGELDKYITLEPKTIDLASSETEKSFTYKVTLPGELSPGPHDTRIIMMQVPQLTSAGTMISGAPTVISKLRVQVPYPGQYAKADLFVSTSNEEAIITISIDNLGTEDIKPTAKIRLYSDGKLLDEIDAGTEIESKQKGKITKTWIAPSVGAYQAVVDLDYGKEKLTLEKEFYIGDMFVNAVDLVFGKFTLHDVVAFEIIIGSGWNKLIKDINAKVYVKDKEGHTLDIITTSYSDVDAFSNATIKAYWDTKEISVGLYDVIINLYYAGKSSEKKFEVFVAEDSIALTPLLKPKPPYTLILIIALGSLIVLITLLYLRRRASSKNTTTSSYRKTNTSSA